MIFPFSFASQEASVANNRPFKEHYGEHVELQLEKRKLFTKTAEDILYLFDLEPFTNRVIDLEDVLANFYEQAIEKDKEIRMYSKQQKCLA